MKILIVVSLVLLGAFSAVHLYASWVENKNVRRITKPFLLILIIAYYIFACLDGNIHISALLVAGLAASWLGDVLLIPDGNKWFTMGGISFMFTHFLFIAVYVVQTGLGGVKPFVFIPAAVVYYGISAVIIHSLKPSTPKMMLIPMYVYLLCNSTMNIFAMCQFVATPCAGSATALAGAVLFFISDCTLFLVRYHKNKNLVFKKHFTVMLTYIVGELLITQGIIMLNR